MSVTDQEFERVVQAHFADLFRFALSLTKQEAEACDLTQQSFYLLAAKGRQVEDASKLKSWLFTTCYREFLRHERHRTRFPHVELSTVEEALPDITPAQIHQMDAELLMDALQQVAELYRVPVMLFYLRGESYREIAALLETPIGTVMSRLARGKEQLRALLARTSRTQLPSTPAMERPRIKTV
jgi:RNA polymerase sigma-70 factor (ECF subfamily)